MDRSEGRSSKWRNSWLVFLLPVLVSAAVMFACGAVFFGASPGPKPFAFSSHAERTPVAEKYEEAGRSSEFGSELDSAPFRTPSPRDARSPRGSIASRRGQPTDQISSPSAEEEEVDWELEMADSEELEPTPEMIEAERQKIREGKASFGFAGRPGVRLAETLRNRVEERRAERQERNSGQATVSPSEDTEIRSENAVKQAGTAGAGPR